MATTSVFAQELLSTYRETIFAATARTEESLDDLWELDRKAWVQQSSSDGGTVWRIVGDRVVLNAVDWPSLERPDGAVLSGRTVLLIEARELLIDMPLRFEDGGLIINARSVSFGPRGVISFVSPQPRFAQQFQITAQTLSFHGARRMPLSFTLEPARRALSVSIERLREQDGTMIAKTDLAFDAIQQSSLSRRATNLSNGTDGTPVVSVLSGETTYFSVMGGAYWPQASVLKLQRFFARSPYDDRMRAFVLAKLDELAPAFEALPGGIAEMSATRLAKAIGDRTDLFGLSATDVPMTPLGDRLDRFESLIDGLYGPDGELALWDRIAVSASTSGAIDMEAYRAIAERITKLEGEMITLNIRADELNVELTAIENEVTLLNQEMATQEHYVKQQIIADTFDNPNDGVPVGVAVLATVGSIAFPAAAPFFAVASGIVNAQYVLDVNESDALSKVTDVIGVVQNHVAIVENTRALRSQWDKVRTNFSAAKKYVTDHKALTEADKKKFADFKKAFEYMKKSGQKLYEILAANKPMAEIIFDEERIRNDPKMIAIVKARNVEIDKQTSAMEDLASALARYEETSNELLQQAALLSELQALDLTNDRENLRLLQITDVVRRGAVLLLAREAVLLRRLVRYVTGQEVDLPQEILLFAEGNSSEQQTFVVINAAQLAENFQAKRNEEAASYRALLRRATAVWNAAQDGEGWNVEVPIPFTAHISANTGDPDGGRVKHLFLTGLNRLIADAIRFEGRSGRIPLPVTASTLTTIAERAIVAGINVSKLTFKEGREPDAQFVIVIEHPRVGAIYRRGKTEIYSDSSTGVTIDAPDLSRWHISLPNTVAPDWKTNFTQDRILGNLSNFVGPFFAPYTVSVEVTTPMDWSSAPEIESIAIEFIVAKPS